jgi:squalene-hopene/tetraprenyl-beta-curcumene cyclase
MQMRVSCCACLAIVSAVLATASAADPPGPSAVPAEVYQQMVGKAIAYLRVKGQAPDGSYSRQSGIGVTAIVTTALLQHGLTPADPQVAKSLAYLQSYVQPDGSICEKGTLYPNYETSLAVLCFTEANKDGRYKQLIAKADRALKEGQWDESEGKDRSDPTYGGGGYGRNKRPDLSNTSFLIDALRAAGNDADSDAIKKALVFISRCQNLESEHNTTPFPAKNPDGGFYYTPAAGGSSMAGETANGGLRSYGSMTYAGLKSMIYAGVGPNDPRVQAAVAWAKKYYTVKENPGIGTAGLYYYYHLFAKALAANGQDTFEDAQGAKHNWRAELVVELAKRQQENGSWINENSRWLEGDPNLVTAYALLALNYCRPKTN